MQQKTVSAVLGDNLEALKQIFRADRNADIIFRSFKTAAGRDVFLCFIEGMSAGNAISEFVIRPLQVRDKEGMPPENVVQAANYLSSGQLGDIVTAVLSGDVAVFFDGMSTGYAFETKGFERRGIAPPATESTIKGSQESFCEALRINTSQLRRLMHSAQLVTEFVEIGELNRDTCAIMYVDGIVNKEILDEVRNRVKSLKADFIMGTGMLEQMIEDSPFSLFPSILSTERPDRAAYYLSCGRVVILMDGTPFALIVPVTFALLMDSPEGLTQRWLHGTFSRVIRLAALLCTTMLSGIYLAVVLFHREMLPTTLVGAIMRSSATIPLPLLLEVLVMELFFELVREAGLRIPQMLGSALSIVGALILGSAAVEANLVSPITLIVVAISGVSNAALPDYDLSFGIRAMKLIVIFMGAAFGFLGIAAAMVVICVLLANQSSFGVPMLSMQGLRWSAGTSVAYQPPLWKHEHRPRELKPEKDETAPHISREWTKGE
ncbi:MAG: spore germination protein [Oscillospiraceae bacterium]|nr:spore germination protein [Oscillospiraceae bacterium]